MRTPWSPLLMPGILLLVIASAVRAETPPTPRPSSDPTHALAGLQPKAMLRVDVPGNRFEGQFLSLGDSSLVLRVDVFDDQELAFGRISQLSIVDGNHRRDGAAIGGLCGAVAGLVLGATAAGLSAGFSGTETSGNGVLIGACAGTFAGIMVGGLIGSAYEIWVPIWP